MPQLIRPTEVKVITKDGEIQVSIILDLNINLTASGGFEVSAQARQAPAEEQKATDTKWAIPDFKASPKIDFGKKE